MGGIDWLFGAVLAGFTARGVCRGLLVESLAFSGLLASAAIALLGAGRASAALAALGVPSPFSLVLAGAGLFLLGLLLTDAAERLARTRLKSWRGTRTDRAGGAFAGALKGAALLSLVAALLLHDAAPLLTRLARPLVPADLLERGKALAAELAGLEIRTLAPADPPRRAPAPRVRPA